MPFYGIFVKVMKFYGKNSHKEQKEKDEIHCKLNLPKYFHKNVVKIPLLLDLICEFGKSAHQYIQFLFCV